MSSMDSSVFFLNPSSGARIELPKLRSCRMFTTMCFSAPPTSSDCLVVGTSCIGLITIGVIRRGEKDWFLNHYEFLRDNQLPEKLRTLTTHLPFSESNPIFYRGFICLLGLDGVIGMYNLKDQSWKISLSKAPVPYLSDGNANYVCQGFLAELDGDLVAVCVYGDDRKVAVFRSHLGNKIVWRPVRRFEGKMLYVSKTSSFAQTADDSNGMDNKIYFPKLCDDNGGFYSLSTGKFHSFAGDFCSNIAANKLMRDLPFGTWMTPTELEREMVGDEEYGNW